VHIRNGTITVVDRGPGIDAADAVRVFDRFYRAEGARGLPGSGLGLAIVRDVAEAHGGTVFARTRPGGGAAVGFTVDSSRRTVTAARPPTVAGSRQTGPHLPTPSRT
jgi:two-component system sensor histidine kinase MprB